MPDGESGRFKAGQEPEYLTRLLAGGPPAPPSALRAALRGDCHAHSDWSDGGSPPLEMALAARDLGHEWIALTDHSPRLTVARPLHRTAAHGPRAPAVAVRRRGGVQRLPRPRRRRGDQLPARAAGPA